jgi:hypothetical protein
MTVELPLDKVTAIQSFAKKFLHQKGCTAKELERFVGRLESVRFVTTAAPLYYRHLQRQMLRYRRHPHVFVQLSRGSLRDLLWWHLRFPSPGFTIRQLKIRPIDVTITTDAAGTKTVGFEDRVNRDPEYQCSSFTGYGAWNDKGDFFQKAWVHAQKDWHINAQELFAAGEAIAKLSLPHDHVLLRIDNQTAEAFLRRSGGTRSRILCDMAVAIRKEMLGRDQILSLQHISSQDNDIADMLSRFHQNHWEYSLHPAVFRSILSFWQDVGTPDVDIFASRENHLLPRFVAWGPDSAAVAQDAFTLSHWGSFPWVHPPTPLLTRVLHTLDRMKTLAILVCPLWPNKPWWPVLHRLTIDRLKLPPARQCLSTSPGVKVRAYVDPLYAFLVQGGLHHKACLPRPGN